ncbi:MAG TPA: MgtC/SapB family protein [Gaiellaceae bacterium]|nr:MgtC/SapB family protein [Gaiellaceae bacterium]
MTLLALDVATIDWPHVLLRLGVAAALGGAIGVERELRDREAGLRTHMLVSLGAALFTVVSAYGFADVLGHGDPNVVERLDPSRIAAQVVSGIGFLGAGAIIRQGLSVRGLTTAASLWIVAAIGMASGAGMYPAAVIGTALVLFSLGPLRMIGYRTIERFRPDERRLHVELQPDAAASTLLADVHGAGYAVHSFELEDEPDRRIVTLHLDRPTRELAPVLSDRDYVLAVRWRS